MSKNGVQTKTAPSGLIDLPILPQESRMIYADFPDWAPAGEDLRIDIAISGLWNDGVAPTLHYRHTDQTAGLFNALAMEKSADGYTATIPAEYLLPEWDIQVYITVQEADGACTMLPGIYHPIYPYPFHVITIG